MTLSAIVYSSVSIFFSLSFIIIISTYIISRTKKEKKNYSGYSSRKYNSY